MAPGERWATCAGLDGIVNAYPGLAVGRLARATLAVLEGDRGAALGELTILVATAGPVAAEAMVVRGLTHLDVPNDGIHAAGGQRMLDTLNAIGGRAAVNIAQAVR